MKFIIGSTNTLWSSTVYKYENGNINVMETTYEQMYLPFGIDNAILIYKDSEYYYILEEIGDGAGVITLDECKGAETESGKQILSYGFSHLLDMEQMYNSDYVPTGYRFFTENGAKELSQSEAIEMYNDYFF